ncbi:FkbM family methyltransferase [Actinomadura sp. WMMA1423]|uniref:FkbM family methyltransferase n=1 Tax=Actinomadura sp. WMMA1423 TaxID=2591108 RepID=UPI00143D588D|nr:FkbM family methyltransferase [Actinomadura sp. WMMA1423]
MQKKDVGRALRSRALSARLLTEFRVQQMRRSERSADLARCMEVARPGSLAIDVGASVGNYAMALSKAVGRGGHVIALEANPEVFQELVRSTWSSRISPFNLAASSRSGRARMYVPMDRSGRSLEQLGSLESRQGPSRGVDIRCVRLDDIVGDARPVSVLKIDVEGHELEVLRGATDLLARDRPALVIEIEQRHLGERTVADTVQWINDRGYTCHGIRGRRLVPWKEYDIERDQLRWLRAAGAAPDLGHVDYVNNFLFMPLQEGTP